MSADILPFPVSRRLSFLERQAEIAARLKSDAGIRYIRHQIETQAATMRRKGIAEHLVNSELAAMDAAIRTILLQSRHPDQTGGAT